MCPVQCTYFISVLYLSISKHFKQLCSSGVEFFKKEVQSTSRIIFNIFSIASPNCCRCDIVCKKHEYHLCLACSLYMEIMISCFTQKNSAFSVDNSRDKVRSRYNVAYLVLALSKNCIYKMYIFVFVYIIYIYKFYI